MKITLIAGSNREHASSTQLLRYIEQLLTARQHTAVLIDLQQLPLPLYSPDAQPVDTHVQTLLNHVADADGLIFASPEYHGSISGTLKNALDYLNAGHVAGKPVLAVSSAGGPLGVSSLLHLQSIVRNLHGVNCPDWISIGFGQHSFDTDARPVDSGTRERVSSAVAKFVDLTRALAVSQTAADAQRG